MLPPGLATATGNFPLLSRPTQRPHHRRLADHQARFGSGGECRARGFLTRCRCSGPGLCLHESRGSRSGSSSKSSSSKSGRSSKSDKIPLSISHGSSSRDDGRSKTTDTRYYPDSFLDPRPPQKKPLSCQTKDSEATLTASRILTTTLQNDAYTALPYAYLVTEQDLALAPSYQDMMITMQIRRSGVDMTVFRCPTGHSPHLTWTEGPRAQNSCWLSG